MRTLDENSQKAMTAIAIIDSGRAHKFKAEMALLAAKGAT